jgi:hypothetical protein
MRRRLLRASARGSGLGAVSAVGVPPKASADSAQAPLGSGAGVARDGRCTVASARPRHATIAWRISSALW